MHVCRLADGGGGSAPWRCNSLACGGAVRVLGDRPSPECNRADADVLALRRRRAYIDPHVLAALWINLEAVRDRLEHEVARSRARVDRRATGDRTAGSARAGGVSEAESEAFRSVKPACSRAARFAVDARRRTGPPSTMRYLPIRMRRTRAPSDWPRGTDRDRPPQRSTADPAACDERWLNRMLGGGRLRAVARACRRGSGRCAALATSSDRSGQTWSTNMWNAAASTPAPRHL